MVIPPLPALATQVQGTLCHPSLLWPHYFSWPFWLVLPCSFGQYEEFFGWPLASETRQGPQDLWYTRSRGRQLGFGQTGGAKNCVIKCQFVCCSFALLQRVD